MSQNKEFVIDKKFICDFVNLMLPTLGTSRWSKSRITTKNITELTFEGTYTHIEYTVKVPVDTINIFHSANLQTITNLLEEFAEKLGQSNKYTFIIKAKLRKKS